MLLLTILYSFLCDKIVHFVIRKKLQIYFQYFSNSYILIFKQSFITNMCLSSLRSFYFSWNFSIDILFFLNFWLFFSMTFIVIFIFSLFTLSLHDLTSEKPCIFISKLFYNILLNVTFKWLYTRPIEGVSDRKVNSLKSCTQGINSKQSSLGDYMFFVVLWYVFIGTKMVNSVSTCLDHWLPRYWVKMLIPAMSLNMFLDEIYT